MNIAKAIENLREDGYCIIPNVFPKSECDHYVNRLVRTFECLGTGIDRNKIERTWKRRALPPQTRPGLFQRVMGFSRPAREVANHPRVKDIFKAAHNAINPYAILPNAYVSLDGINVKPPQVGPFHNSRRNKDWPHLDETKPVNDTYRPKIHIQGQVVLTNSTAAFVCTPKSHYAHSELLKHFNVPRNIGFWRFPLDRLGEVKDIIRDKLNKEKIEGELEWQRPIYAEAGSMILWLSTLIHSAKYQDAPLLRPPKENSFEGWRCVIYVCHIPLSFLTPRQVLQRERNEHNFRCSNHSCTRTVPRFTRHYHPEDYDEKIHDLLINPRKELPMIGANMEEWRWDDRYDHANVPRESQAEKNKRERDEMMESIPMGGCDEDEKPFKYRRIANPCEVSSSSGNESENDETATAQQF